MNSEIGKLQIPILKKIVLENQDLLGKPQLQLGYWSWEFQRGMIWKKCLVITLM